MHSRRVRTWLSILFGFAFLWLMGVSWVYPASAGGSEVTVTLTPVADAYVDEPQPDVNFGGDTALMVRNELPGSGGARSYALLRFDLSALPDDVSVTSASLHLTQKAGTGDALVTISAMRSLNDWAENTITWNAFPGAGAPASALNNIAIAPQTEYVWDVTALVAAWMQGTYANYGFVLGMDPAADAARAFWSRESARGAPYLEITYVQNTPGLTDTPTPTSTPTSTPTFTPTSTPTPTPPPTSTPDATATPTPTPNGEECVDMPSPTVWWVTRAEDDIKAGSLRCALLMAGSGDVIRFDPAVFPPDNPSTIYLQQALPHLQAPNLVIDGTAAGVILDGSQLQPINPISGLYIEASATAAQIKGLIIRHMPGNGIEVHGDNALIGGSSKSAVAASVSGAIARPPATPSIVIGGNKGAGVVIFANYVTVQGAFIGMDPAGLTPWPNEAGGVVMKNAYNPIIGGLQAGQGNLISGNLTAGVILDGQTQNAMIRGNFIGAKLDGIDAAPNAVGVLARNVSASNWIGDADEGAGNLISGNGSHGIALVNSAEIEIMGNFIGVDIGGNVPLPNQGHGVFVSSSSDNFIGGPLSEAFHCAPPCNLIAGNQAAGAFIEGAASQNNVIEGNFIGASLNGTNALGNGFNGVVVANQAYDIEIGRDSLKQGNLISGNQGVGVFLQNVEHVTVESNRIGVTANGKHGLANTGGGILLQNSAQNIIGFDGGSPNTCAQRCNLVAGNGGAGLKLTGDKTKDNYVQYNFIGVNLSGDAAIPNAGDGVLLNDGARGNTIGGNLIAGNKDAGVHIMGQGTSLNKVWLNDIGYEVNNGEVLGNETGVKIEAGASVNMVGRAEQNGLHNTIVGNRSYGVVIDAAFLNVVERNIIKRNGGERSDAGSGILITRGAYGNVIGHPTLKGNDIFANAGHGVEIKSAHDNTIIGNYIGSGGSAATANQGNGVFIHDAAHNNHILGKSGNDPLNPNTIAFNGMDGVRVSENSLGNTIIFNSIYANGWKGIRTLSGGNKELPPPQVTQASVVNGQWTIQGQTCANCAVHVYTDDGDEARYYEGQTQANASGAFSITIGNPTGKYFALTATDADGNTSEFGGVEDIEITGIEVTQVVQSQSPDNVVPLIAHKRTFARVHVRSTYTDVANIDAILTLTRGNAIQVLKPTGYPCNATITVRVAPQRENLQHSFCFELPDKWTGAAGGAALGLKAEVNPSRTVLESDYGNNIMETSVTFQDAPPFELKILPIAYIDGFQRSSFTVGFLGNGDATPWFKPGDKIAAGDLNGDSQVEIFFASQTTGGIYVFDVQGQLLTSFNAGFAKGDDILVADITNSPFDKPRLLVAHADADRIEIWKWANQGLMLEDGFDAGFDEGDGMAVGRVLPATITPDPQILIAPSGEFGGRVYVWSPQGWMFYTTFPTGLITGEGWAVGDVIGGDGLDEVVAADYGGQRIEFFRWQTDKNDFEYAGGFDAFVSPDNSLLLVGDLDGDSLNSPTAADEIILGNASEPRFDVFDWTADAGWKKIYSYYGGGKATIWDDGSAGAIADVNGDGRLDVVTAHPNNLVESYASGTWDWVYPPAENNEKVMSELRRTMPAPDVAAAFNTIGVLSDKPTTEDVLDILWEIKLENGASVNDLYLGVGDFSGIRGRASKEQGVAASEPGGASLIPTHEIAHLLGREHVVSSKFVDVDGDGQKEQVCGNEVKPTDPNYPYPNGQIGGPANATTTFFGFDVGDPALGFPTKVYSATGTFDVMTYCSLHWVSDYTYKAMWQALSAVQASNQIMQTGPVLGFSAKVDPEAGDGVIKMAKVWPQAPLTSLPASSSVMLRIENADGAALATYPLPAEALRDAAGQESSMLNATAVVPFPAQAAVLRLELNGVEIASRAVSAHPPDVTLLAPNAGETLSDSVTLQWQGEDADGDALSYSIQYSADGGQTWTTVALDVQGESYALDLSSLPGSEQARFRIIAYDGVRTGMDATDGDLTVTNKPPTAFIEAPWPNGVFAPDQNILLRGRGHDLESPTLPDSAFVWKSNISGELGTGPSLLLSSLPRGRHVITLTVTDDQGRVGRASTTIYVGVQPQMYYFPYVR